MDPFSLLRAGGPALVPLLLGSTLGLTLAFERLWFWRRIWHHHDRVARRSLDLYRHSRPAAIAYLQTIHHRQPLPVSRIALAALAEGPRPSPERFRLALHAAIAIERPHLQRFDTAFRTLAAVAPLLGLLGTILGLTQIFRPAPAAIAPPTNLPFNPDAIASGIGQALLSTAAGLVIAIGAITIARLCKSLRDRHLAHLHQYGGQLELLYRRTYWHLNIAPAPQGTPLKEPRST